MLGPGIASSTPCRDRRPIARGPLASPESVRTLSPLRHTFDPPNKAPEPTTFAVTSRPTVRVTEMKQQNPSRDAARAAKLTTFPSGAFTIDVSVGAEVHVVEYLPSLGQKFGVSRMSTAVFGWEGVENAFESFQEVEDYLVAVSDAAETNEKTA
jgi:hypothetical protein